MGYEWDPHKAIRNLRKHKVDFADTITVFEDTLALTVDEDSLDEERFNTVGTDLLDDFWSCVGLCGETIFGLFPPAKRRPQNVGNIAKAYEKGIRFQ